MSIMVSNHGHLQASLMIFFDSKAHYFGCHGDEVADEHGVLKFQFLE